MDADFPAAHSMDTHWFAVDRDGHVACFFSGEDGAVPVVAAEQGGSDLLRRVMAIVPPGVVVFDIEGHIAPGGMNEFCRHAHQAQTRLVFLRSLEPARDEIAAGRAYEVPAATDVAVVFREAREAVMERLHRSGDCLGCIHYDPVRDDDP